MALNILQPITTPTPTPTPGASEPAKPSDTPATGIVSEQDAYKGADHTQIKAFSLTDASGKPIASGTSAAAGSSVALGSLVQGKFAVELTDALIPALLVLGFKYMKLDVRKSELQLTEKEKNVLAPIYEACMNSIVLNFNSPWTTLIVAAGAIYGGKVIEHGGVKMLDRKISEGKSTKDITDHVLQRSQEAMQKKQQDTTAVTEAVQNQRAAPLGHWTEDDVAKVDKKRKKGKVDAVKWLEKNWVKVGGRI